MGTTSPPASSRSARTARCFGPPSSRVAPVSSSTTSKGPRMRKNGNGQRRPARSMRSRDAISPKARTSDADRRARSSRADAAASSPRDRSTTARAPSVRADHAGAPMRSWSARASVEARLGLVDPTGGQQPDASGPVRGAAARHPGTGEHEASRAGDRSRAAIVRPPRRRRGSRRPPPAGSGRSSRSRPRGRRGGIGEETGDDRGASSTRSVSARTRPSAAWTRTLSGNALCNAQERGLDVVEAAGVPRVDELPADLAPQRTTTERHAADLASGGRQGGGVGVTAPPARLASPRAPGRTRRRTVGAGPSPARR